LPRLRGSCASWNAECWQLQPGLLIPPDDANDIFQDAMLAAYRALPNFKLESKFSTWLHKIVVNTALSNRRKLKRTWQKMAAVQSEYEHEEKYVESHSPCSSTTVYLLRPLFYS
jgi:RNA polymerase sigma-70 factor (ECF subfamily)